MIQSEVLKLTNSFCKHFKAFIDLMPTKLKICVSLVNISHMIIDINYA